MEMIVNCPICGKILTTIVKDSITQQDIDLYTLMCACKDHPGNQVDPTIQGN
jgi:hypothetical protein